jgi:hypothetical protein
MSYDDERQHAADEANEVTIFMGGGKTYAGLAAYWRVLQTPADGEDGTGGTVDERFTPVPDEELERRFAELDSKAIEPLPEEIESLSDGSRFLKGGAEIEEAKNVTQAVVDGAALYKSLAKLMKAWFQESEWFVDLSMNNLGDRHWQPAMRDFAAVLFVGHGRITELKLSRCEMSFSDELDYRRKGRGWKVSHGRSEELRALTYDSLRAHREQLRDAVQTYSFVYRCHITVVVDNVGATRDPDAALTSLITEATDFGAAEANDGTWTLVMAAPVVAEEHSHAVAGPRLAVMELPGVPSRESAQQQNEIADPEESELLRRLMIALETP